MASTQSLTRWIRVFLWLMAKGTNPTTIIRSLILRSANCHSRQNCLDINPVKNLHLGLFGLFASKSYWYDFNNKKLLEVPSWKTLDVSLTYALGGVEPYIRMTNAFDRYYYTEPGFPWRGRYLEIGIRADVFSRSD